MAGAFLAIGVVHLGADQEPGDRVHRVGHRVLPARHERAGAGAESLPRLGARGLVSAIASLSFLSQLREHHQGDRRSARRRLLPVSDRVCPVRQRDHRRSAQSRLRGSLSCSNDAKDHGRSSTARQLLRAASSPHAGLGRPGARRRHPARRQPDRLERAARCPARSHQGSPLHDLRGHAQNPARHRRAGRHPRLLLQEARRSRAELRQDFERVRTLLEQYSGIARGKLQVAFLDPEPFSDAEDRAVAAGLKGIRLNQEGEMGYFGIVGIQFHRYRVRAFPSCRPTAKGSSNTT